MTTILEPAPSPVEPAVSTAPVGRRAGGVRWAVALVVAVLALGIAAAAFMLAAGSAPVSRLAGWMPAGTVAYAELRLDPPGDQGTKVADLLGHVPGFADRSQLDAKLSELADKVVGKATGGTVTYSSMKPWLGDALALALTHAPTGVKDAPGVAIVATKDAAALRDWLAAHVPAGGTSETYAGTQMTTGTRNGMAWAYTVLDTVMVAGEKSAVEAAIDTRGSSTFASSEPFRSAVASLDGASLGFGFVDTKALVSAALAAVPSSATATNPLLAGIAERMTPWMTFALRAQSDALEVDAAMAKPAPTTAPSSASGSPLPTFPVPVNATSSVASHLPADTILALESRDLGPTLAAGLARMAALRSPDATAGSTSPIAGLPGILEGAGSFFGWMGDGALVVRADGGAPSVGAVALATDPAAATTSIGQLRALLALAGAGSGVTLRDESYGGGTITIADLGDAAALGRDLAAALPSRSDGTSAIPGRLPTLPTSRVELAWTVQHGLFVVGLGDAFVKAVLDTASDASLATTPDYRTALDRAGSSNAGQSFVDIPALVALALPNLSADERATYERDIKPFIDPLGGAASAAVAGDPLRVRFVVTVK